MQATKYALPIAIAATIAVSVAASIWLLWLDGSTTLTQLLSRSIDSQPSHGRFATGLLVFFIVSLTTQLLVVPSGSILLIAAGFTFGATPATLTYALAQLLSAWPVYAASAAARKRPGGWARHASAPAAQRLLQSIGTLRQDALLTTITLRLTPLIPSAVACVLAAMLQLPLRFFLLGTLAVCWVRPLFFASSGASLAQLGNLRADNFSLAALDPTPLVLVFAAAIGLLLLKRTLVRFQSPAQRSDPAA